MFVAYISVLIETRREKIKEGRREGGIRKEESLRLDVVQNQLVV